MESGRGKSGSVFGSVSSTIDARLRGGAGLGRPGPCSGRCDQREERDSEPYDMSITSRTICMTTCQVASPHRIPIRSLAGAKYAHTMPQLLAPTTGKVSPLRQAHDIIQPFRLSLV